MTVQRLVAEGDPAPSPTIGRAAVAVKDDPRLRSLQHMATIWRRCSPSAASAARQWWWVQAFPRRFAKHEGAAVGDRNHSEEDATGRDHVARGNDHVKSVPMRYSSGDVPTSSCRTTRDAMLDRSPPAC